MTAITTQNIYKEYNNKKKYKNHYKNNNHTIFILLVTIQAV